MDKTDATPAANRGSECNDLLGPTVAEVFAKMRKHRPDWNAYGQSRESAADLAVRCALELAAEQTARVVAEERERLKTMAHSRAGQEAAAAAHYAGKWQAAFEMHLTRNAAMCDLINALFGPNAEVTGQPRTGAPRT